MRASHSLEIAVTLGELQEGNFLIAPCSDIYCFFRISSCKLPAFGSASRTKRVSLPCSRNMKGMGEWTTCLCRQQQGCSGRGEWPVRAKSFEPPRPGRWKRWRACFGWVARGSWWVEPEEEEQRKKNKKRRGQRQWRPPVVPRLLTIPVLSAKHGMTMNLSE